MHEQFTWASGLLDLESCRRAKEGGTGVLRCVDELSWCDRRWAVVYMRESYLEPHCRYLSLPFRCQQSPSHNENGTHHSSP
jgi:hypothetical protein